MKPKSLWEEVTAGREALRRFWLFSDLQQSDPRQAERCMYVGVDDFLSLDLPIDAVCYLGDSTEGSRLAHLEEMAEMQVQALSRVDAPIYYALGNHEFDYHRNIDGPGKLTIPMRDRALREKQWHLAPDISDWSFSADFGDMALVLLTDHADPAGRWCTTHSYHHDVPPDVHTGHDHDADAVAVRKRMEAIGKPFFTFSHYSFCGGNRDDEGDLQDKILPLPPEHVAHFYGHCHIGDRAWGGKNYLRQISTINETGTTQFDIASFEDVRGTAVRSAILEWYGGHAFGVFFRDHSRHLWEKAHFEIEGRRKPAPK